VIWHAAAALFNVWSRKGVKLLRPKRPSSKVNFINVLGAAFTCADPKSAKKTYNLTVFIALLGYVQVKAARKMLVKSTPQSQGDQFHHHFVISFCAGRFTIIFLPHWSERSV